MLFAAVALAGLGLSALAAAVTVANAPGDAWLAAAGRTAIVAVPFGVGIYAWRSRPQERFGPLLIGVGFGWFLTTLAESQNEVLYSVGRVAGWMTELGFVYLILSFPLGRLTEPIDRRLMGAATLLVALVYVPAALLTDTFLVPSPYTSCTSGCPDNAFFVLGSEPSFVDSLLLPLRELLTALLFLAVTLRLIQRVRGASRLMRRTLEPVLNPALLRCTVLALALAVRRADPGSPALDGLVWIGALALPLTAAGFLAGLLSWRVYAGSALQHLGARVRAGLEPDQLEGAIAAALDDPGLKVVRWDDEPPGEWTDFEGNAVTLPGPDATQSVTELRDGGRRAAAIVHDAALGDKPKFLDAVASYAQVALQNRRLAAEVRSALGEVRESRARLVASADAERRRIERDLHDGAQQRLVALRIQLELAEELLANDPELGKKKLHSLGGEVDETLDEIRALASGVYPSLLGDQGLADALRAAALRVPLSVSVKPDGIERYSQDVESAVYFCCMEALQNASKHARNAKAVTVSLTQDRALRFQVRDDGEGFDVARPNSGSGLINMRDRIVAVGGELAIRSSGRGTVVTGSVPILPV